MPEDIGAAAVAEPIESAGVEESVEMPVEGAESGGEVTESGNESDSSGEKDALTAPTASKGKLNLADVVKKSAEALKAINPALPGALRTAAFELGSLYREFPGGLKEAVAQKQALGEIGGVEGIKETQEALNDYAQLETLYENGDPAFFNNLADALPASFSQIMPAGLAKWKAIDKEGYDHHQARVFMQTLDEFGLSQSLENIWSRLDPEKNAAERSELAKLWAILEGKGGKEGGFRQKAATAPERKVNPQDEALTKREQELQQREQKALLSPIANEGKAQIQTITDREMTSSYKWAETDPSVKQAVGERVRLEVLNASKKDKAFTQEFDRLLARGDSAGLSRHVKNFQDRVTPAIVQRTARLFAVKPKGAGPIIVKKPTIASNGTGAKTEPNWTRVSRQPSAREIDYAAMGRNAEDMLMSQKAILKDGRRVNW